MILTENSMINNNFSDVEECTGDPFEYISNASYACAYMEAQINLSAICAEYAYLRENGVEAICEANIIVSIFTAIKTAIVTCAKKIAQFFKSVIDIIGDKLKNLKNKITSFGESTILTESDNDYIDLSDVYISRLSSSFSVTALYNIYIVTAEDVVNDTIELYREALTEFTDAVNGDKTTTKDIRSVAYKKYLVPAVKQVQNIVDDNINSMKNSKLNKSLDELMEEFIYKEKIGKVQRKYIKKYLTTYITEAYNVQKNVNDGYSESAKILRKYSDEVNSIEKTMIQYINRLNMTNNQSDNYQTFNHSIASLMNKLINTADSIIVTACNRHCSLCMYVIRNINYVFQKI